MPSISDEQVLSKLPSLAQRAGHANADYPCLRVSVPSLAGFVWHAGPIYDTNTYYLSLRVTGAQLGCA